MPIDTTKAPFPWPGGKRRAAAAVWAALGDVTHYVEPFYGTGAVLLNRPHEPNRTYFSETVGDADGWIVNFWRAVVGDPDGVAEWASWPVTEADKHARLCWLLANPPDIDRLCGDPEWFDVKRAGWWVQSVCLQIGDWPGPGPWWPDEDGRLRRWKRGEARPGVSRELPHLGNDGMGVNHPGLREPGVSREVPFLNHSGRGVLHGSMREPGIVGADGFHPMVMPELRRWMAALAARLRHVRVIHGDWRRTVGTGVALTLSVRQGKSPCGVFLDPPYAGTEGSYAALSEGAAVQAAQWAVGVGDDPRWRIVTAGYADDDAHRIYLDAGWTEREWYAKGFLTGGYKRKAASGGDLHAKARRERLYLSPHCLRPAAAEPDDGRLFAV